MKNTPTLIKRGHCDNVRFLPAQIAIALESLYHQTKPLKKRKFTKLEIIEGAYKQAGKVIDEEDDYLNGLILEIEPTSKPCL